MRRRKRRRSRTPGSTKLLGIIAIIVALVLIYTSGARPVTRELVQAQLAAFTQKLSEQAAKSHTGQVTLSYDDIQIEGFAFDKRAIVLNPTLRLERKQTFGTDVVTLNTPRFLLMPDRASSHKHYVEFPEPFRVIHNTEQATLISFAGPVRYVLTEAQKDGKQTYFNALLLPEGIQLSHEGNVTPADQLQISFSPHPDLRYDFTPETGADELSVAVESILIAEDESKSGVLIGALNAHIKREAPQENRIPYLTEFSLIDAGLKKPEGTQGFYNLKLSISGTTPTTEALAKGIAESDAVINEATLSRDNFNLTAKGKFSERADDSLPFGKVDISLVNFSTLRETEDGIPANLRPYILQALTLITGQDAAVLDNTSFTIAREKLGPLQIGNATFEDMLKILFTNTAQPAPASVTAPAITPTTQSPTIH